MQSKQFNLLLSMSVSRPIVIPQVYGERNFIWSLLKNLRQWNRGLALDRAPLSSGFARLCGGILRFGNEGIAAWEFMNRWASFLYWYFTPANPTASDCE